MTASTIRNNKFIRGITVAAIWLVLWQLISIAIKKEILFVSPFRVVQTLFTMMREASFWQTAGISLLRVLTGFMIGLAVGTLLAALASGSAAFYALIKPAVSVVRATPVASFIILALVWISNSTYVPIFISSLMVIPIAWGNVLKGAQQTDEKLLEMAKAFDFSKFKTLRLIRIPSVMPYFMSACTTGLGLAWKAGIAAEVLCRPKFSIGGFIYDSKLYLETPQLFAWTTLVVILSVIIERMFVTLMNRILKRYNTGVSEGDA